MDEQNNNQEPKEGKTGIPSDFGHVVETLHNKSKLPALRSYQGDVSQFIKDKNESVISVAVKEKERQAEREEKGEAPRPKPKVAGNGFKINVTMVALSLFLIAGGATALFYIFEFVTNQKPTSEITIDAEVIPFNNIITLANITKDNLAAELTKTSTVNGVNIVKISDTSGNLVAKAKDFFNFMKIANDLALRRGLKDDFAIGVFNQNDRKDFFLVIKVSDFGTAFSNLLDWEERMIDDLTFLDQITATTQTASTTANARDTFVWKDLIIKNKDTRALTNNRGAIKIAYTFLDKNTVLITNSTVAIADMSSAYISRSVAR